MRRICMLILGLIGLNENWLKLSFVTVAILERWLRTKKDAFQGYTQLLQIQTFSSRFFPHIVVFFYTVSIYYRSRVRRFTQYKSMICFGNLSSFWHLFVVFLLVFSWLANHNPKLFGDMELSSWVVCAWDCRLFDWPRSTESQQNDVKAFSLWCFIVTEGDCVTL